MSILSDYIPAIQEDLVKSYIKTVTRVTELTDGPAALKLYRALRKVQSHDINDSNLYRVCKWIETHPNLGSFCSSRQDLAIKVAKGTGVGKTSVLSILRDNPFRLPPHLKPRPYKSRTTTTEPAPAQENKEVISPISTPNKDLTLPLEGKAKKIIFTISNVTITIEMGEERKEIENG